MSMCLRPFTRIVQLGCCINQIDAVTPVECKTDLLLVRWPDPALGGGDAPWCRCPSEWCEDVNYQNPHPHPKVSCSAAGAKLLRFQRNQSAELSHNASVGRWAGYAYQTDPVKSYADMVLHYTKKMLDTFADGTAHHRCCLHHSCCMC